MDRYIGVCGYCGQANMDGKQYATKEEADNYATNNCDCSGAQEQRRIEQQIEDACTRVERLFGESSAAYGFEPIDSEKILKTLRGMVACVATGTVRSAKLTLNGYGTASISMKQNGKIRVQRSETNKHELEE